jgi:5-hydroxyisourate hydrolase-like protein (transthyretin family)
MRNHAIYRVIFSLFIIIVTATSAASQDRVTLRDGTIFSGRMLRMSGDTLFFKTSFINELAVSKEKILTIEFGADNENGTLSVIGESFGTGKLMVIVTGPTLTTTIRFRRGGDRAIATEANSIVFRIKANEKVAYEKVDDKTDEEVRSEGWTILKNNFQFGRYEVSLPAGEYRIDVFVGNDLSNDYRRKFNSGAVSISKKKENVKVFKDGVTTLVLKSTHPFLSLGNYDLKWVE